jgi:hypothetical protein
MVVFLLWQLHDIIISKYFNIKLNITDTAWYRFFLVYQSKSGFWQTCLMNRLSIHPSYINGLRLCL